MLPEAGGEPPLMGIASASLICVGTPPATASTVKFSDVDAVRHGTLAGVLTEDGTTFEMATDRWA